MSDSPATAAATPTVASHSPERLLVLGALGVAYGDIGTSPLYALRECFLGPHSLSAAPTNVLGAVSLILWALVLLISVKYLAFVLRADNQGEGGILALMTLALRPGGTRRLSGEWALIGMGVFGAALLYADGMITPAISVLSALEGLNATTSFFQPYLVAISVVVLALLFLFQSRGTARIGTVFGPVMLVWFVVLGLLGVLAILRQPRILAAIDPRCAVAFFSSNGWSGFLVLGSVFLAMTGGEALYADLGHFGRSPIRRGWYAVVLPALALNYCGQGAILLENPAEVENLLYRLAPAWALFPMVLLATAATIIASQAVISGTFSLTAQAVQLGYSPRTTIRQTSKMRLGQVYLPGVNWAIMLGTIGLVLAFRESTRLAGAYGIAVSMTMLITTVLLAFVAVRVWHWPRPLVLLVTGIFLVIDFCFFSANLAKLGSGGWLPLLVAGSIYLLMSTWRRGRGLLRLRLEAQPLPVELFIEDLRRSAPGRVPGIAVFLTGTSAGVPVALLHNLKHNRVVHATNLLLTIQIEERPYVPSEERLEAVALGEGLYRVILRYGFAETPDVPADLASADSLPFPWEAARATFFVGRQTLIVRRRSGVPMAYWRRGLFAFMSRNALDPSRFFNLPPHQVVELGIQLEL